MIKDVSKSIKANMYERASSPLFGAFILSWVLWNYKTLLVILSSMKVNEKITYIESDIYGADWSLLLGGTVFPLISAILFILIYPYPAKWIYGYWHKQQKDLKTIKQNIEDETPLTIEESLQVRRELLRLESHHDEELVKKSNEINRLKDVIKSLENEIKEIMEEPDKNNLPIESKTETETETETDVSLSDRQEEVLFDLAKSDGKAVYGKFVSDSKFDAVTIEYYLEDLETKGYLIKEWDSGYGSYVAKLTTTGKRFVVEQGVIV